MVGVETAEGTVDRAVGGGLEVVLDEDEWIGDCWEVGGGHIKERDQKSCLDGRGWLLEEATKTKNPQAMMTLRRTAVLPYYSATLPRSRTKQSQGGYPYCHV
ncbi:hypothetical protein AWENTII_005691 [Aspergillus wentii]